MKRNLVTLAHWIFAVLLISQLSGCASTPVAPPKIARISAEELEQIMPKPVPNITLEELVTLSKTGTSADALIDKIKASNSRYDLTPSQAIELAQQGVDARVLDYIHQMREIAVRDNFADEINKREKQKIEEQERIKREARLQSYRYYDPFWGSGWGSPYWHRPFGSGLYYRWGW
jgi:hypothetical protein